MLNFQTHNNCTQWSSNLGFLFYIQIIFCSILANKYHWIVWFWSIIGRFEFSLSKLTSLCSNSYLVLLYAYGYLFLSAFNLLAINYKPLPLKHWNKWKWPNNSKLHKQIIKFLHIIPCNSHHTFPLHSIKINNTYFLSYFFLYCFYYVNLKICLKSFKLFIRFIRDFGRKINI